VYKRQKLTPISIISDIMQIYVIVATVKKTKAYSKIVVKDP